MKCKCLIFGLIGSALAGQALLAHAACTDGTQVATMFSLVNNNTVCAMRLGDRWQEFHQPGGTLIDYKKGPGDPVDPQETVGSWSTDDILKTVTYNYGTGGTYTYTVYQQADTIHYNFCSGTGDVLGATFMSGGPAPCPP